MAKTKNHSNAIAESLEKIVNQVKLENLFLETSNTERNPDISSFDDTDDDTEIQEYNNVEVFESKPVSKRFYVVYHLGIRSLIINEEETEPEQLFTIQGVYRLDYSLKSRAGIRKKDVEVFGLINSIIHVWPYWREFVHRHTLLMSITPIILNVKPTSDIIKTLTLESHEVLELK